MGRLDANWRLIRWRQTFGRFRFLWWLLRNLTWLRRRWTIFHWPFPTGWRLLNTRGRRNARRWRLGQCGRLCRVYCRRWGFPRWPRFRMIIGDLWERSLAVRSWSMDLNMFLIGKGWWDWASRHPGRWSSSRCGSKFWPDQFWSSRDPHSSMWSCR